MCHTEVSGFWLLTSRRVKAFVLPAPKCKKTTNKIYVASAKRNGKRARLRLCLHLASLLLFLARFCSRECRPFDSVSVSVFVSFSVSVSGLGLIRNRAHGPAFGLSVAFCKLIFDLADRQMNDRQTDAQTDRETDEQTDWLAGSQMLVCWSAPRDLGL